MTMLAVYSEIVIENLKVTANMLAMIAPVK